jgi:hypothetical protein
MIILLFLSTIMVLLAYVNAQNVVFYYAYVGALFFSFVYAFQYSRQFKDFKETLYLFIPSENNKQYEPLSMEVEDLALKCALYYRNRASFEKIAASLNLPQRKVQEGKLLRE